MELPELSFDAPIAGQSLTAETGNRNWQQPPQFTTVEQAVEHYLPKLLDPKLHAPPSSNGTSAHGFVQIMGFPT